MRLFSSRSSLFARHAFVSHQYIGSLLFFGKIYLSAHMITVLKQRAPRGFGDLGRMAIYFQGALVIIFRDFGSKLRVLGI